MLPGENVASVVRFYVSDEQEHPSRSAHRAHRLMTSFRPLKIVIWSRGMTFAIGLLLLATSHVSAQQFHRQSFESNETLLKLGLTNGQVELLEHSIVEDRPHSGQRAERFHVRVTSGDFALVEYSIEPTQIIEELEISAFVNATRPGTIIQAHVVLPREKDLKTDQPMVTLLTGSTYDASDRYRKLVISRLDKLLARQQQLLQNELGRAVDVRGAYVDQVVFNVMSGLGEYEIRVDDIVIGPIVPLGKIGTESIPGPSKESAGMAGPTSTAVPLPLRGDDGQLPFAMRPEVADRRDKLRAEIVAEQLLVGKRAFLPRGMARTTAPLRVFHETGMNLVVEPFPVAKPVVEEAASLNLLLMPALPLTTGGGPQQGFTGAAEAAATFDNQSVFFYVGGPLDRSTLPATQAGITTLRHQELAADRLLTADVNEGIRDYSRKLDMVGAARFPLQSSMDITSYQKWVSSRKGLLVPGTFFWTWIQTHPPREYVRLAYGHDLDDRPFTTPIGPTPTQIRLLTYASLAAGSRGLLFTSDRWLGESAKGRARTLGLALLNTELTLIEPFIADGNPPIVRPTSNPNIEVAVFKHTGGRGVLALAYWKDAHAQCVLNSSAANNVQFIVPGASESAQAFEISPTDVRGVKRRREVGGILVSIDEFDSAAFVVLTTDAKLFANYQEMVLQVSKTSATWMEEIARIELEGTESTDARLEEVGKRPKESVKLLGEARKHLTDAKTLLNASDFRASYTESLRSLRNTRELQSVAWKNAVGNASPTASVFTASYHSLPEQYRLLSMMEETPFSNNLLRSGSFDDGGTLDQTGWAYDPHVTDDVTASAMLVPARNGKALEIKVEPTGEPPFVLENTRVQIASPPIRVEAGQIVRLRGKIRIPKDITASVDGVMVWDSLGGESLALRYTRSSAGEPFELVRPVRESGEIRLHLVMTGIGSAEFDDLKVEVASPKTQMASPNVPPVAQLPNTSNPAR
ncbi:hypothetical protein K2X85_17355 [bacterium]|nr:hypothetical protein [bacterium]